MADTYEVTERVIRNETLVAVPGDVLPIERARALGLVKDDAGDGNEARAAVPADEVRTAEVQEPKSRTKRGEGKS